MKRRIISSTVLVLALGVGIWSVSNLSTSKTSQETTILQIGYLPVLANLPLFTALENGYFEKYNLHVEAIEAQSPNHVVEGILAGRLDGAGILAYPVLFAAEEKSSGKFKLLASGDETDTEYVSAILVKSDSPINKPEDLKGKKIGVYTGLVQVMFLKSIITGMGMDPEKDIQIVEVEPRLQLQGLQSGLYDALSTVEPFPTIAKDQGNVRVIIENPRVRYVQNPYPSVAVTLSSELIQNNPEAAKAYGLAMQDAINFIRENPDKIKTYLVKYASTPVESASKVRIMRFNQLGEEDLDEIQRSADWMLEKNLLKQKVDVRSMFLSPDFLRN